MNKWQTLEHNGPIFPKEYEYVGFDSKLSSLAEEMLYHYSAKLETEYVSNSTFNKNFWNDLKPQLPKEYQSKKLEDFLPLCKQIFEFIQKKKEEKKLETKESKLEKLKEKEEIKEKYGYCILNGERQPIASPMIEGPGIFIARGKHPQLGCWKYRVQPEDVCINASNWKDILPPKGHKWKEAYENKDSFFLSSYSFQLPSGKIIRKGVQFASTSVVKQNSDQKKFEKAQTLIKHWKKVQQYILNNVDNKDKKIQQCALVSYLIMNLGIRVGDEKGEDEADTVGASTLRAEHLTLTGSTLSLKFPGKDSVEYKNSIELPIKIQKIFETTLASTKKSEMLFPSARSLDVTAFLSEVATGITAKVFRTAHGSSLLAKTLKESKVDSKMSQGEKIAIFNEANLLVAKKLNHQKNVGKKTETPDLKNKLEELKESVKLANSKLAEEIVNMTKKISQLDSKDLKERDKQTLKKSYRQKIENYKTRILKNKQRIKEMELKVDLKSKTKNIALGTSKTNYCDPRVGISWCRDFEVNLEKIYNKAMQAKFSWALSVEKDYYKQYITID